MQVWQVRTIISVININWNGFHSLSNIFIPSAKFFFVGKFWQILANFGKHFFWQTQKKGNILSKFAKVCQKFRPFFNICQKKQFFGKLWQILANFGKHFFWQTQKKGNISPKFALPPPTIMRTIIRTIM